MQTTPPIVMARAPNAGAVQPCTRKMAEVAIRVAMVMPEMGLAELPMRPTMRELTVTKRNPKKTMRMEAARLARMPTWAPGTGLNSRKKNMRTMSKMEPTTAMRMEKSFSVRMGLVVAAEPPVMCLKPELRAAKM